jgi:hypothetical protein
MGEPVFRRATYLGDAFQTMNFNDFTELSRGSIRTLRNSVELQPPGHVKQLQQKD